MKQPTQEHYARVEKKAEEIELELKRLNRWSDHPLPAEKFENMGAFGSNTMTFEQWLQFVLIPRIRSIVEENGEFPQESSLATYAYRYYDGFSESAQFSESDNLHERLYELDKLISDIYSEPYQFPNFSTSAAGNPPLDVVSLLDQKIPSVVYTLAGLLKEFEGEALESQLQTFDTFLAVLSPKVRPDISKLLSEAAKKCQKPGTRERVERAADAVAKGERAAEPYDHEKAMKRYMEEHAKSFGK